MLGPTALLFRSNASSLQPRLSTDHSSVERSGLMKPSRCLLRIAAEGLLKGRLKQAWTVVDTTAKTNVG